VCENIKELFWFFIPSYSKLYEFLRFHTCYGWLHFWDWFYGTDAEFIKSKALSKRHDRFYTLKSARELFPDK